MKRAVFLTCIISIFCLSSASDEWVRGTVSDQDGNPVAGAFIKLKTATLLQYLLMVMACFL